MVNFIIGNSQIEELSVELRLTIKTKNLTDKRSINRIAKEIAGQKTKKITEELANQIMIQAGF